MVCWEYNMRICSKEQSNVMCQENSVCIDGDANFPGYHCKCSYGYRGKAYIPNGFQDVNECEPLELNDCLSRSCKNTYGSYTCVCPKGHQGIAKRGGKCTAVGKLSVI